jgi:hypothetical protein
MADIGVEDDFDTKIVELKDHLSKVTRKDELLKRAKEWMEDVEPELGIEPEGVCIDEWREKLKTLLSDIEKELPTGD